MDTANFSDQNKKMVKNSMAKKFLNALPANIFSMEKEIDKKINIKTNLRKKKSFEGKTNE